MGNVSALVAHGLYVPPAHFEWTTWDRLATIILFLSVWFLVSWIGGFPDSEGGQDEK